MHGGSSGSSERTFDMSRESDILDVLKLVRHSALDVASKDEIRDTVFAVRTQATPELINKLQTYLSPLRVNIAGAEKAAPTSTPAAEPVAEQTPQTTPQTTARSGFAGGRPQPQFGSTAAATTPTPAPAPTTPTPVPAANAPEPAPEKTEAPKPKPETPADPVPAPPTDEPAPAEPKAETTPEPAAAPATDASARIAAIKQAVNAKVGNPVNLIDSTNEVGREYMNALLEAMKATQGGGDTATAMQRLEKAYAAVEQSLSDNSQTATASPASESEKPTDPTPAPATTPTPAAEVAESVPQSEEKETAPQPDTTTNESEAKPELVPETPAEPTPAQPTPATPKTDVSAGAAAPLQSVAAAAGASNTTIPQPPEPEKPTEPTDPLLSEAVTNGLSQLLSEWKIFKASGFLGTGSKGTDHPLYKELRNLPMNLVVAGRFEGASIEVKQSIHDYMNGWRYEQGITHDLKETFEHYLRRVVKTIIDKQQEAQ